MGRADFVLLPTAAIESPVKTIAPSRIGGSLIGTTQLPRSNVLAGLTPPIVQPRSKISIEPLFKADHPAFPPGAAMRHAGRCRACGARSVGWGQNESRP